MRLEPPSILQQLDTLEVPQAAFLSAGTVLANRLKAAVASSGQYRLPQQLVLRVDSPRTKLTYELDLHPTETPKSNRNVEVSQACNHYRRWLRLQSLDGNQPRSPRCSVHCRSAVCAYAMLWWTGCDSASQAQLHSMSHCTSAIGGRCAPRCSPTSTSVQRSGTQPTASLGAAVTLRFGKPAAKHAMLATSCRPPESMSYSHAAMYRSRLAHETNCTIPHRLNAKSRMRQLRCPNHAWRSPSLAVLVL